MKKVLFGLLFMCVCSIGFGQCESENIDIEIDPIRGSVRVISQYTINGKAVDVGGVECDNCTITSGRYDESQGTLEEILLLNENDRKQHCENTMKNRLSNEQKKQISDAMLAEKKKKNEALKDEFLKTVGTSITKTETIQTFKDLEIKIDADKKITITDKSLVTNPVISK